MIKNNSMMINTLPKFTVPISPSSSPEIDKVTSLQQIKIERGHLNSALFSAKSSQLRELEELYETRNYFGWDGYDAEPITNVSKTTAEKVLNMLPLEVTAPEIVPTCEGGYSLEWRSEKKYLVIEIENLEVSCILINAGQRKKKTSFTESYSGEREDFAKWIIEEFPFNG